MKTLHVNTHLNVGGIGHYIVSLCKALKARGADCMVASSGGDMEQELEKCGVRHVYLDINTKFEFGPKVFRAAPALAKIIRGEGIDIVHAHTRVSQAASLFASRRANFPYISTCHGFFKTRLSRRLVDTWGEKVIAISDAVRAHLEKDFRVDADRIELIYNGVDVERFSKRYAPDEITAAKRSLGLKDGPVIGAMGRLSPVKGQRFLIEAMKHLISRAEDTQCLIIGSGPEEDSLKDMVKSLGLNGRIYFTGSRYADVPILVSCMDIFVLPSIKEGLGLALLEALSAGRPCIASDTGGIGNIIKDGVNGMLFPVGDSKKIADAILKLLGDKPLAERMGRSGASLVKERYSIDTMAGKVMELYKKVIK